MISIQLSGRLGNQMFQYAVCRTVAEKMDMIFIYQETKIATDNISNYFVYRYGVNENITNTFQKTRTQKYNPEIFNISDNTLIWGFYQTDKYISDNNEMVKKWFNIEIDDITNSILKNILLMNIVISISEGPIIKIGTLVICFYLNTLEIQCIEFVKLKAILNL
jgi:hypothetical protein